LIIDYKHAINRLVGLLEDYIQSLQLIKPILPFFHCPSTEDDSSYLNIKKLSCHENSSYDAMDVIKNRFNKNQTESKVNPEGKLKRTRDPQETVHRLVEAALTVISTYGYAEATVDRIVQEAGLSKGAFYHHFASKEDLFIYLLESRSKGNQERLMQSCCWEGNAGEWLYKVFDTILSFPQNDLRWQKLSVEYMSYGMRNPRIAQYIASIHQEWRQLIATPLRESEDYRSGKMLVDPDTIAACITGLIDGILIHSCVEPETQLFNQLAKQLEPLFKSL
jgi:AcrR family transcriptional regulator